MTDTTTFTSTKEVDYLDEDKPIKGQNYVLLSFISPEDVIVNKEQYYFTKFLDKFAKDVDTLFTGIVSKYPDSADLINNIRENHKYICDTKEMNEQYKFFKSVNSSDIESDYHRDNNFQTTIRGLKVRGVFDTIEEAKKRSEFIKKLDNKFDIFIGQVGCWCPWAPNPNDLENQEYAETQLNTLMKQYKANMDEKDALFEERKKNEINISKERVSASSVDDLTNVMESTDPWTEKKEGEAVSEVVSEAVGEAILVEETNEIIQ